MEIRDADPAEYEMLGELLVDAYGGIAGFPMSDRYAAELRDIATRTRDGQVLVAVVDGQVVGTITYVAAPSSSAAEFTDPEGCGIRMLAVEPPARGRGVGRALTAACLATARAERRRTVYLHTTDWMPAARAMYESMGFERAPALDWTPEPGISLRGYRLALRPPP